MTEIFTRMNYLKMTITAAMAGLMMVSCNTQTKEETEQKPSDSAVVEAPAPSSLNSNQSELLQTILGTPEEGEGTAVLRGISFGDPVSKVKETERFELFEDSTSHVGFTSETAQLETIDVQYQLNGQKKVSKIMVDVYLNSADATKQLWEAGKSYFGEKGKLLKEEPKKVSWITRTARIIMEDVSEGKDYGLKFQFTPANKTELAAQ